MQVYPNPVQNQLFIKGCNAHDVVKIINMTGQVLTAHEINYATVVDVSFLPPGLYFLKTENAVRKFVKE